MIHPAPAMKPIIDIRDMQRMRYAEAWELQQQLREQRIVDAIQNTFLFVEHPRVFTLGKRDCEGDLLVPREIVAAAGIEIVKSNRGGRITYHGPGQIVGYFIFSLASLGKGVVEFVSSVEELCIRTLADFGVNGQRDPDYPGVWVGDRKIAAVGLHFAQGVSQHGFALNVAPDLEDYRYITPCGIRDRGMTSIASELKQNAPAMEAVKARIALHLHHVFAG